MSDDNFISTSVDWELEKANEEDCLKECKNCGFEHETYLSCAQIQWKNSQEYKDLYRANLKRALDEVARLFK